MEDVFRSVCLGPSGPFLLMDLEMSGSVDDHSAQFFPTSGLFIVDPSEGSFSVLCVDAQPGIDLFLGNQGGR